VNVAGRTGRRDPERPGPGSIAAVGVVLLAIVCCAAPALLAAGVLGTIGAWLSSPWVIAAAVVVAVGAVARVQHFRSRGKKDSGMGKIQRPDMIGRAGRGRIAPVEGGLRAVHQEVVRSFAAGHPPTTRALDEAAAPYGATGAEVVAMLHAEDFLRLGDDGAIRVAYPFSAVPTPHRVRIEGDGEVYSMCAIDALGIAAMLGRDVVISSADPRTGTSVTVEVTPDGLTRWQPDSAVVLAGEQASPDAAGCCDPAPAVPAAADVCCGVINFFETRESATAWLAGHPGVTGPVHDQASAHALGVQVFGRLLD
jgi:hypothetical protein